jgi:hypothetical protein
MRPSAIEVATQLGEPIAAAVGTALDRLRVVAIDSVVARADGPSAFRISDASGEPRAVLLCSAPLFPDMVKRAMERAAMAKSALDSNEAVAILDPMLEGRLREMSYALLTFCPPLAQRRPMRWIHRLVVGRQVLEWLYRVTLRTVATASSTERPACFAEPLARVAAIDRLGPGVRADARRAVERLENGSWQPKTVLMHGDLWMGNVLLGPASRSSRLWPDRFVIVDWPGCVLRGHAIFDLVRLTQSMRMSDSAVAGELLRHCEVLQCGPEDAMAYLLAALGHLEMRLEQFPVEQFLAMARGCHQWLEQACSRAQRRSPSTIRS